MTFYRKYETFVDQDSKIQSHIIGYFDEAVANRCVKAVLLLHANLLLILRLVQVSVMAVCCFKFLLILCPYRKFSVV